MAALHRGLYCLKGLKHPSVAAMHHTLELYPLNTQVYRYIWENPSEYKGLQPQQQSQYTISVSIFFQINMNFIKATYGHYTFSINI